jgi:hypothetical protein
MWWDHQNFGRVRKDKKGTKWNFRVWHDMVNGKRVARVFFWNDKRDSSGIVLFPPGARTNFSALHSLIEKLVADPKLRAKHQRKVRFPLERYYSEYGALPEESKASEKR